MKFMKWSKDGGPESTVSGLFFIEIKGLFSIVLLKFDGESRPAYHTHAFNCFSWLLRGILCEQFYSQLTRWHYAGPIPFCTYKRDFHKVDSIGTSWVLSFRGPWNAEWEEYDEVTGKKGTLTHGREEV